VLDTQRADKSETIFSLRAKFLSFLERSNLYDPFEISSQLPKDYLYKEQAFLLAIKGEVKKAFEICVNTLSDVHLAAKIAEKAYKMRDQDKSVYTLLYAALID